jgi:hypothetical protein
MIKAVYSHQFLPKNVIKSPNAADDTVLDKNSKIIYYSDIVK